MKLNTISSPRIASKSNSGPRIVGQSHSPAALRILFPSGEMREYIIHDDYEMAQLIKQYGHNMGDLVVQLKLRKYPVVQIARASSVQ